MQVIRWITYESSDGLQVGHIWVSNRSHMSHRTNKLHIGHIFGYTWVVDESHIVTYLSQMNRRWVSKWVRWILGMSQDESRMNCWWVSRWVTDQSLMSPRMSHKCVSKEWHIGYTFKCNISHFLFQTDQSLTSSQLSHTSDEKNENNFRPIRRM